MALFAPFDTAARLVDCVCAVLSSEDRPESERWAGTCGVWPGNRAAVVDCCENGGQLTVNVVNGYPTTSFPSPSTAPVSNVQPVSWATVYEIKATRCIPTDVKTPTEDYEAAAAAILNDLHAILQGIVCCFVESDDDDCAQYVINTWSILPPQGGCSGVVASVTVESDAICCPREF